VRAQVPPLPVPPQAKPVPAPAPPPPPASTTQRHGIPLGEWEFRAAKQEADGPLRRLRGNASIEGPTLVFQADEIDFNHDTGELQARGHVYFEQFERNEKIWADHVEYNTEAETGKFYDVRAEGKPRIDSRPGVLTTAAPYFFQGKWAERRGERYILHNGFFTNCKMPRPWWRLRGPKFVIQPDHHATAYNSTFLLRKFPLFFTPFFYKSLERLPRKSGFLMPNIGNSSVLGFMFGVGYYWAINRSYDVTYRLQDFTSRGYAHHVDFRAKPRAGTDFDVILYGVQDRGLEQPNGTVLKQGGFDITASGKSDLGNGFTARGQVNYLSSLTFRQAFTQSFNEAIFSEVHSVVFINKNWNTYTFNAIFARLENFQRPELQVTDPVTGKVYTQADAIIIRKLPEAQLSSRDRQIREGKVPLWFSFQSSAGLLFRGQPVFNGNTLIDQYQTTEFTNRLSFEPQITTAFHWKDFSLVPSFSIAETLYGQSQAPYQDRYRVIGTDLLRSSRNVTVDFIMPSLARVFDKKTRLGEKLKHVIEPRATYRYVTGIDDFNRLIRFDETDLLSNTNELEVSLTNRLYAKRGDDVREVFSWELTQKRFFDPTFGGAVTPGQRNVLLSSIDLTGYAFLDGPRHQSPVVSVVRVSPRPGFGVEWRADYDPVRGEVVNSGVTADYRRSNYFVSVGHSQVNSSNVLTPTANQVRIGTGFGNENRRGWNAGAVVIYDYRLGIMQYAITQVTYNVDCCGFNVQYRRFNFGTRDENQFRLAFVIANIGSFGTMKKQERLF
jgi:LPS-assembly protein